MFDKQKYINSFIKNNYRTIKLRIRNDDKILINKTNNVDNINKYILDLIKNVDLSKFFGHFFIESHS